MQLPTILTQYLAIPTIRNCHRKCTEVACEHDSHLAKLCAEGLQIANTIVTAEIGADVA